MNFSNQKLLLAPIAFVILGTIYVTCFVGMNYQRIPSVISNSSSESDNVVKVNPKIVKMLHKIRKDYLIAYNPNLDTDYTPSSWKAPQHWQQAMSHFVIERLGNKRNGFFVECGAFDGYFLSNSLLLEREYNWTGLLVEADTGVTPILKSRNRHAWVSDVCLAPEPRPMKITMKGAKDPMGHGYVQNNVIKKERMDQSKYSRQFQVDCFPLAMLLDAIEVSEVDYLSLDVEGLELDILKTIPWYRIRIQIISVEIRPENSVLIKKYMESLGYEKIKEIRVGSDMIHDHVYELKHNFNQGEDSTTSVPETNHEN